MKEIACRNLGHKCNWKHTARTEDLLVDIVALHLRDVHGMKALTQDMVSRIKNASTDSTVVWAPPDEATFGLKEFTCSSIGMKCGFRYIAQTEDLIVDGVAVHAREAHGITEFTPELKTKVENSLHEWRG